MPVSALFSHHDEGCWRAGLMIRRSWTRVPPAPLFTPLAQHHFPETQIRACDLRKCLIFVILAVEQVCDCAEFVPKIIVAGVPGCSGGYIAL
jgi:hypothetical protein